MQKSLRFDYGLSEIKHLQKAMMGTKRFSWALTFSTRVTNKMMTVAKRVRVWIMCCRTRRWGLFLHFACFIFVWFRCHSEWAVGPGCRFSFCLFYFHLFDRSKSMCSRTLFHHASCSHSLVWSTSVCLYHGQDGLRVAKHRDISRRNSTTDRPPFRRVSDLSWHFTPTHPSSKTQPRKQPSFCLVFSLRKRC